MKVKKNPWTVLFPCPVVLVTSMDSNEKPNIITLAWVGTTCSEPPMLGFSIRPERHSYTLLQNSGECVVNIPTKTILKETDLCGLVSGRDVDKFLEAGLTPEPAEKVGPPMIRECPVNMECLVRRKIPLGVHHLFICEIVAVHVDEQLLDDRGRIDFEKAAPIVFNQGQYWGLQERIASMGFSKK